MDGWTIGVIGGSGLYAIDALDDAEWMPIESPWGAPSDSLLIGRIDGVRFVFLPRHGRGHRLALGEIDYRANLDVLKRAGCTDVVAVCAVGSLNESLSPGTFVVADQFVDRTVARAGSFFGSGLVAHVSLAEPVCGRLSAQVADAADSAGAKVARGGTYLAIEGPQFSTGAESRLYRGWGCDVIGMTGMPEARLAREAELPYALVAMVTDYDCWRESDDAVELPAILAQLEHNADTARRMIVALAHALPARRPASPIDRALDGAIITAPEARDPNRLAMLDAICPRLLKHRA